ncbi:hypothetical protein JOB18_008645 [Solea senegalensis]|nr:hypothetical protein JOB18_008645 [Solea senegalensis]
MISSNKKEEKIPVTVRRDSTLPAEQISFHAHHYNHTRLHPMALSAVVRPFSTEGNTRELIEHSLLTYNLFLVLPLRCIKPSEACLVSVETLHVIKFTRHAETIKEQQLKRRLSVVPVSFPLLQTTKQQRPSKLMAILDENAATSHARLPDIAASSKVVVVFLLLVSCRLRINASFYLSAEQGDSALNCISERVHCVTKKHTVASANGLLSSSLVPLVQRLLPRVSFPLAVSSDRHFTHTMKRAGGKVKKTGAARLTDCLGEGRERIAEEDRSVSASALSI